MNYTICETTAAITTHLRVVSVEYPVKFGGHQFPRPLTLCGMDAAWDTSSPLTSARCTKCLEAFKNEHAK